MRIEVELDVVIGGEVRDNVFGRAIRESKLKKIAQRIVTRTAEHVNVVTFAADPLDSCYRHRRLYFAV